MKRRDFLKYSAASAAALPIMLNGVPVKAVERTMLNQLAALTGNTDRVLVLVQLNGGNDGLNTVIPLDQYNKLYNARENVIIPERDIISLKGNFGLHPSMQAMKGMFEEETLGIIQDVGYPDPNFSHFRSTDIWTSASPSKDVVASGWLGRYLDITHADFPHGYPSEDHPDPLALTIGSVLSQTCQGPAVNLGMALNNPDQTYDIHEGGIDTAPDTPYGHEVTFIRQIMDQTDKYIDQVKAASDKGTNMSSKYPSGQRGSYLAEQLKVVARLIHGGLQTKIYVVQIGGFDTHAFQVPANGETTEGYHADLLGQVSDSISAFQDDIQLMGISDKVLGMTFSEFGRRILANDSYGTDHGAAAPLFLFGDEVNATVHGGSPDIPDEVMVTDNLPMQFDFRSVYASVFKDWFELSDDEIRDLLFDDFQYIPILKSSVSGLDEGDHGGFWLFQNYPNPFVGSTKIKFRAEHSGQATIRLFDSKGQEVKRILDRHVGAGEHEVTLEAHDLRIGTYYYRLQIGDSQQTKRMMVQ